MKLILHQAPKEDDVQTKRHIYNNRRTNKKAPRNSQQKNNWAKASGA